MTPRKPPPRLEALGIPDYDAIRDAAKGLLMSLDRTDRDPGYSGPLPDIEPIAEEKARIYAELRLELLREIIAPKLPRTETVRHLREAREAAEKFARALDAMGEQATDAWNDSDAPWPDQFRSPPTIGDCRRAVEYFAKRAAKSKPPVEVGKRKGRKGSAMTRVIAGLAANDFVEFTGKTPSRNTNKDEFPEFLASLFVALQIEASATSYVQDAVDDWRTANRLN
jgi:hypothetical protein